MWFLPENILEKQNGASKNTITLPTSRGMATFVGDNYSFYHHYCHIITMFMTQIIFNIHKLFSSATVEYYYTSI